MTKPTGNPKGRPVLPTFERRKIQVNLYMNAAELELIDAARGKKSKSAFIRDAALNKAERYSGAKANPHKSASHKTEPEDG